jgi:excisionase family DNA binding protein
MEQRPELLTIGEAAERLGMSITTVRRWADSGHLLSVRTPGNQRRFRRADVDALLTFDDEPNGDPVAAAG